MRYWMTEGERAVVMDFTFWKRFTLRPMAAALSAAEQPFDQFTSAGERCGGVDFGRELACPFF